ncbi:unnamed protein product [Lepidochelys kempii]
MYQLRRYRPEGTMRVSSLTCITHAIADKLPRHLARGSTAQFSKKKELSYAKLKQCRSFSVQVAPFFSLLSSFLLFRGPVAKELKYCQKAQFCKTTLPNFPDIRGLNDSDQLCTHVPHESEFSAS